MRVWLGDIEELSVIIINYTLLLLLILLLPSVIWMYFLKKITFISEYADYKIQQNSCLQ